MTESVWLGNTRVGTGAPVYVVAEIGLNHNGDLELAKKLIDAAVLAQCNAVKFQKRTPQLCVAPQQQQLPRETPWGVMTYLEYRQRVEFGVAEYERLDRYCKERGIDWFASCWDEPSVEFLERFEPVAYKVASAILTDDRLLVRLRATGRPIILSTGMSTLDEIRHAVSLLNRERLIITHATSVYPSELAAKQKLRVAVAGAPVGDRVER